VKDNFITRFGLIASTCIITTISVSTSLIIACISLLLTINKIPLEAVVLAILVPLIITPSIVYYYGKLIVKIIKLEKEMRLLATYDQLTGLLTRHAILESSAVLLNLIRRNKKILSLLYCDIDYFKKVNDHYSHEAGDMVIRKTGIMINDIIRKSDVAGRLGGEEFLLVLPDTNKNNAGILAEKLRHAIEHMEYKYNNRIIKITISIGICDSNDSNTNAIDKLIAISDKALYKSKNDGRNKVTIAP